MRRGFLSKEFHRLVQGVDRNEHSLKYLFWELTQRCNLSCLHCGSDCISSSHVPDMPLEDFLRVLDTLDAPQGKEDYIMVVITGGEPLLRKDLEACGFAIRQRGFKWGMVTNGYAYTPERHHSLLAAGMNSVTLSLDGMRESHNWLRNNPRSYDRALEAMKLMGSDSDRLVSDVVTCVHQRNIGELEEIYQTITDSGVRAWRLFTIAPIGRAKERPELMLGPSEFQRMMEFIESKRKQPDGIRVSFSCEGYVGPCDTKVRDERFYCRAGINIGSVLIDGSIGACPNVDRSLVQGNIYTDNFKEVWEQRFTPYRHRAWMRSGPCAHCKEFRYCGGNGLHFRTAGVEGPTTCHYNLLFDQQPSEK